MVKGTLKADTLVPSGAIVARFRQKADFISEIVHRLAFSLLVIKCTFRCLIKQLGQQTLRVSMLQNPCQLRIEKLEPFFYLRLI